MDINNTSVSFNNNLEFCVIFRIYDLSVQDGKS